MPTRPGGIARGWLAFRARRRSERTPKQVQEPPARGSAARAGRITRRDVAASAHPADRVPELDALRGLAAVFILVYHFKPAQIPFGWAAVDLFFVLSGYLITGIILREGSQRGFLRRFYARRSLRIWPVYYLTLLTLLVLGPILPQPCDPAGLPASLTYTQNVPLYWSAQAPALSPYLAHTWSLAIEEQFYLIWPVLVLLAGRRGLVPLALAVALGCATARACGVHWWLLAARGDGFALGGWLAAMESNANLDPVRGASRSRAARILAALVLGGAGAVLVTVAVRGGFQPYRPPIWPGMTLLALNLLAAGVVGGVVRFRGRPALGLLRRRRLQALGRISYGLYMYHFVVIMLGDDLAHRLGMRGRPFWREALMAAACFGLAALSWRFLERPLLAWRGRFAAHEPGGPPAPHESGRSSRPGSTSRPALRS